KLENDMKWSSQKSILFQVEMIKLCSENIIEQPVQNVDKRQQNKKRTVDNSGKLTVGSNSKLDEKQNQVETLAQAISKFDIVNGWRDILDNLRQNGKIMLYSNLLKARAI